MIGRHHIYNCLTAAAVGLAYGIDLPTVVRGLEAVECVPGRLQRIECGQPFGVFVDFAHTPDALTGCLKALRQVTAGRVICVFGAGGDRDRAEAAADGPGRRARRRRGRRHQRQSPQRRPAGDRRRNPRRLRRSRPRRSVILDRVEAIHWALAEARPGDCVLMAGKGHETSPDHRRPSGFRWTTPKWPADGSMKKPRRNTARS